MEAFFDFLLKLFQVAPGAAMFLALTFGIIILVLRYRKKQRGEVKTLIPSTNGHVTKADLKDLIENHQLLCSSKLETRLSAGSQRFTGIEENIAKLETRIDTQYDKIIDHLLEIKNK
jgi:hypothetical protein